MKPIIEVNNLFKRYNIGEIQKYYSFRDSIANFIKSPFNKIKKEEFWALKDIAFNINPGEVVGIIGKNGAGKSTLLKILSQITPPTKGNVVLRGRVASLLEVGTGFHPELTGRENIFLNGAILGMKRKEVKKKFDQIVDFAEIEKFLDTPVKYYSSGMYMRLAFAVAAHLEPEILLVDEVLAVGDAGFQKKCLGKMGEVSKKGRTVIFVSHNMEAVSTLCQKAMILDEGHMKKIGTAREIIQSYLDEIENISTKNIIKAGDEDAKIINCRIVNKNFQPINKININESMGIEIDYEIIKNRKGIVPNFALTTIDDIEVLHNIFANAPEGKGRHRVICWIPANLLNNKKYKIIAAIVSFNPVTVDHAVQEMVIDAVEDIDENFRGSYRGEIHGVVRPYLTWEYKK